MSSSTQQAAATLPGSQVQGLLGRWLEERRDLTGRMCELAGAIGGTHNGRKSLTPQPALDRFCELLVDYVSAGHFEVFRELLDQHALRGTEAEALALYDLIIPSTEAALDFNDRYFRGGSALMLEQDLARLGRVLASRFDCEDALIRCLGATSRHHA
jgi:regulator of sigma D